MMAWMKGTTEGIAVAGGNGEGQDLTQLSHPVGLCFDHYGHPHVADWEIIELNVFVCADFIVFTLIDLRFDCSPGANSSSIVWINLSNHFMPHISSTHELIELSATNNIQLKLFYVDSYIK